MFLPVLLFLFSAQSPAQSQTSYVCGDRDARTEPLRSSSGFSASLTMHSEDDHGKNSHECQADYSLHIVHPDGTRIDGPPAFGAFGFSSSIAEWNRPLTFRIDGFSPDGKRVFILIEEGGQYSFINAREFDMVTGSSLHNEGADLSFFNKLGPACAATLHIAGTTAGGHIVLQTKPSNGCTRAESWQLNADRRMKKGLGSKRGIPTRIASDTHITAIAPGALQPPGLRPPTD
jgi:hypothetical protein